MEKRKIREELVENIKMFGDVSIPADIGRYWIEAKKFAEAKDIDICLKYQVLLDDIDSMIYDVMYDYGVHPHASVAQAYYIAITGCEHIAGLSHSGTYPYYYRTRLQVEMKALDEE